MNGTGVLFNIAFGDWQINSLFPRVEFVLLKNASETSLVISTSLYSLLFQLNLDNSNLRLTRTFRSLFQVIFFTNFTLDNSNPR